ncbi:amino acid permease [Candidatus Enterococcus ikei]|uniref:Amino acid permease n=1 Tax=Candidatus Enterococcus ikei TaxID=2815326 RepID=A0ABS3H323_9ENTE|nr:amino acid permease [Enterococcus sp. DIV0869a]MBO0441880.1 amino acid permease [Enterococcus sp. DIV0869a]
MKTTTTFSPKRLVMIITMTVFSFSSMTTAFFLMGIKAFPYFIGAALFYFIPYAIIIAEFTGVYKNHIGGLYQWLAGHLSEKVAFIAAFLWYCSYFIWMISLFMKLWIPSSILLFGQDLTKKNNSNPYFSTAILIGMLSILAVFVTLFFVSKGFKGIASSLYLSGILMTILIVASLGGNLLLWITNRSDILPNLTASFKGIQKNSTSGQTLIEQLSFLIFAITAFGGLDTIASLVDKTGKQKKQFPKLLIFSSILVVSCYFLGIFLWSGGTDLAHLKANNSIHLGNLMYELMENLGYSVGQALSLTALQSQFLAQVFTRYTALTLLLSYISLLSTIFYLPIRTLVEGTPQHYWHPRLKQKNKHDMPIYALLAQGSLISLFILGISLGSQYVVFLYNQLTLMTNISRAIPYLLVALAYPAFKKKQLVNNPTTVLVPSRINATLLSTSVILSITLAIGFQIYQPLSQGNLLQSLTLLIGPLLFTLLAYLLYQHFHRKKEITQNEDGTEVYNLEK